MATALPATAFNVPPPPCPPIPQLPHSALTCVFRWSALGLGVVYGVVHRSTLSKKAEHRRQQDEYAFKEELIKEARAEYQKKKNGGSSVSTEINWEDGKSIEDALNRLANEK